MEEYFSKGNSKLNQYYCQGDTIIDGKTFNKLYEFSISYYEPYFYPDTTFAHYISAIRNNDSKQVFYRNLYGTSETLIYEFNLNVGDTIFREVDNFVINETDSIEYCGIYRKRYIQKILDPYFPEIISKI